MGNGQASRAFEAALSALSAASLAAAVAFAVFALGGEARAALATAVAAGALTLVLARSILARAGEPRRFPLPGFTPAELGPGWSAIPDELLLTAEMAVAGGNLATASTPNGEALLLDDVLVELAPSSRVVQLFDPAAIPSAGELRAAIDRHLHRASEQEPPDASADLHQALDLLRRSLR